MADTKITALAAITTVDPAADVLPIVDISDTSMAASGTTKKITSNQILGAGGTATLASATITGDLTVDTNTLKVDSTNNDVIVGATSAIGSGRFSVQADLSAKQGICVKNSAASYGASNNLIRFTNSSDLTIGGITHPAATSLGIWGVTETQFFLGGVATTAMTLNSTGLGVGVTPSAARLEVGGQDGTQFYIRSTGTTPSKIRGFTNAAEAGVIGFLNGGGIYFDISGERMRIDASGNLLLACTSAPTGSTSGFYFDATHYAYFSRSAGETLNLNRYTSTGATAKFRYAGTEVGDISVTGSGTTFNSISDYRLKESVAPLSGGLARVNALKPSIYKWKSDGSNGEGFIAHELADVVPLAVTGEKDAVNEDGSIKPQGVDLSRVVPILVAAIKELTAEVNALKNA
jgi:hypothetical protein